MLQMHHLRAPQAERERDVEGMCKRRGRPLNWIRRIGSRLAARHTRTAGTSEDAATGKAALRGGAAGLQHGKGALVRSGNMMGG